MNKKVQLFLLPFAGGSSLSFIRLIRLLNPSIDAITVEYAGRGSRKEEAFIAKYDDFLDDVVAYILKRRLKSLPYAVLGYSLGSALSFDICCKNLLNEDPIYSFFCAEGSLLAPNPSREYGLMAEREFRERVIALGGLDKRILNNKEVLDSYLNVIKQDHNVLAQFSYQSVKVKNDASIIYSPEDFTCINMQDWKELIDGKVDYYEIGDNHFFINQHYKDVAEIINDKLIGCINSI